MLHAVSAFELDQPKLEVHAFASLFPIDSIVPRSLYLQILLILIYTALDLALGIDNSALHDIFLQSLSRNWVISFY
jgi:hypothetical protein